MQRRKQKGKKKRGGGKAAFRQKVKAAEGYEGMERITVGRVSKIPKPIHSILRTRQAVNSFAIENSVQNGSTTQPPAIGVSSSSATLGNIAFSLQDIDNYVDFTALFDQYRIDKVVLQLRSRNRSPFLASAALANQDDPLLYLVIDRDDGIAPGSLAVLREYDNVQQCHGEEDAQVVLEPSVTPAIYASGAFTGYGVQRTGIWLDCASTAIAHYGVKFGVSGLNAAVTWSWYWDISCWYYLSFRNVR